MTLDLPDQPDPLRVPGNAYYGNRMARFPWRWRLLLVAIGLLIGLAVSESCLRVYDAWAIRLRFRNPPNYVEDAGTLRLAILGESTANGFPYHEGGLGYQELGDFNLLTYAQVLLKEQFGCQKVEIDNYAARNIRAEFTVEQFWKAKYKPNALVLYCGNNEFPCSYKNRAWRPRWLWPIGISKVGALLLRWANSQNSLENDPRPDALTSDLLVPSWELEFNRNRYRQCIEAVLRHCKEQGILAIVVVPETNHLFCPNVSIFQGPAERKKEAVRLFKEAFYLKHFANNESRAKEIMEQLVTYCGFAHLYFELGETYYRQGQIDKARYYLHAAIESDLYPPSITEPYKQILRDLAAAYGMPCIEMAEVLDKRLLRPVPDNACFIDPCHLTKEAYVALCQEIVGVLRAKKVFETALSKDVSANLPVTSMRLMRPVEPYLDMSLRMADGLVECDFVKLYNIQRAIALLQSDSFLPKPHPPIVATKVAELEERLRKEKQKLLEWTQQPDE